MIRVQIIEGPITPPPDDHTRTTQGAELVFRGRVRGEEDGRPIVALDYEHYQTMADRELTRLAREAVDQFDIDELHCTHRVGRVAVGEASMQIIIWAGHRAAALDAMEWFIHKIKQDVPIWKWGVTAEGERFPSGNTWAEGND